VTNSRSVVRHAATTEGTKTAVCSRGIAERRKRSDAKGTTGNRSVLIVPTEAGELALGEDPVEGSETSYHGAVVEKDDECIEIRKTCQRNSSG
jgi:hypothetical protein